MTVSDRRHIGAILAVAAFCSLILTCLLTFSRGPVATAELPRNASLSWTAVDATTGQPVSREEWISRALASQPQEIAR
jgi:hypothetical protein